MTTAKLLVLSFLALLYTLPISMGLGQIGVPAYGIAVACFCIGMLVVTALQ